MVSESNIAGRGVDSDKAWAAVTRRDRSFDGRFVTGVLTTGIYCRPSCAARHPLRENVRFFVSGADARAAGLRACKRCLPDDVARDEAAVLAAIDAIKSGEKPNLEQLARITGYSPSHFQRVFKRATGLSPAAYARALREERAKNALSGADRVTDAIYDAGYEAPSRFYAAMEGRIGMSASDWKNGGAGRVIHYATVATTLGKMLVAASEKGVCCLAFDEGEEELRARFPNAELAQGGEAFRELFEQVTRAVEDPATADRLDIPLDVKGTAFQQRVWQALREIPAGETRSYGELAAALGKPSASRAVGGANGANNIAVLIPCHRVIQADGSRGGYAYGTKIKAELLKREGAEDTSNEPSYSNMTKEEFAALHRADKPLILFNIWDAGSAKAVAGAGAPAIATGSQSLAKAQGFEDGEAIPFDALLNTVRQISGAISLPLTVDFEAGYAQDMEALSANAAALLEAGAVGCNFEDQLIGGEGLRDTAEQCERIAAVAGAGLFVNARTDTFLDVLKAGENPNTAELVDAAIERGVAYQKAGAGSFFIPGLSDMDMVARVCREVALPVNVMRLPGMPSHSELGAIGVARISYGPAPWRDAMETLGKAASEAFT